MKRVRLRDLRRSPRHRILDVNDNLTRMMREAEIHQQALPNERVEIGHDPTLGTYILYSSTKRKRY
jgi:hypothetical protein